MDRHSPFATSNDRQRESQTGVRIRNKCITKESGDDQRPRWVFREVLTAASRVPRA